MMTRRVPRRVQSILRIPASAATSGGTASRALDEGELAAAVGGKARPSAAGEGPEQPGLVASRLGASRSAAQRAGIPPPASLRGTARRLVPPSSLGPAGAGRRGGASRRRPSWPWNGTTRDGSRRWNKCWWCSEAVLTSPPTASGFGPALLMREILDPPGGGTPTALLEVHFQAVFSSLASAWSVCRMGIKGIVVQILADLPGEPR